MTRLYFKKPLSLILAFSILVSLPLPAFSSMAPMVNVGKLLADVLSPNTQTKGLSFGIALFRTNDPADTTGQKFQKQLLDLTKSIWPKAVITELPKTASSAADAQKLVEESGTDWLLWGAEEAKGDGPSRWTFGIELSDRLLNFERISWGLTEDRILAEHIPSAELPTMVGLILKNSTFAMRNALAKDSSQEMAEQIKETDQFLEDADKRGLPPEALRLVQVSEAALLSLTAFQKDDKDSKLRAIRIYEELLENTPEQKTLEKGSYYMSLGLLEGSLLHHDKAIENFQKALPAFDDKLYPRKARTLEFLIAQNQLGIGTEDTDLEEIHKAIQDLEALLGKLDKKRMLDLWVRTQNCLGSGYAQVSQTEFNDRSARLSLDHLMAALTAAKGYLSKGEIASMETSLTITYGILGARDRNLDYLEQAVITAQGAADTQRSLNAKAGTALALVMQSQALRALGAAKDDPSLLSKAKGAVEESLQLVSKEDNLRMWVSNKVTLADLETTLAIKTADVRMAAESMKTIQEVRTAFPEMDRYPDLFISEAILHLSVGGFNCDEKELPDAQAAIDKIEALPMASKNPNLRLLLDEMKTTKMALVGYIHRDPATLRSVIAALQADLDALPAEAPDQDRRSILSSMGDTFHDLLALDSTPTDLQKGHQVLEKIKALGASPFPAEATDQTWEKAELISALGIAEKDPPELAEGLKLCEGLSDAFAKRSRLSEGGRQQLMGRIELALGEKAKDPEALKKAVDHFTQSLALLKDYGSCHAALSVEGLQKAKTDLGNKQ